MSTPIGAVVVLMVSLFLFIFPFTVEVTEHGHATIKDLFPTILQV